MLGEDLSGSNTDSYFLSDKKADTTLEALKHYHIMSERQTGIKLRCICTDGGGECVNELWDAYCKEFGIKHETTAAYSSSANGVAEQGICTVVDWGGSMMVDAKLPHTYWAKAFVTAIFLKNFIPSTRSADITQHEMQTGKKPDISYLQPFGCTVMPKSLRSKRGASSMLDPSGVSLWDTMAPATTSSSIANQVQCFDPTMSYSKKACCTRPLLPPQSPPMTQRASSLHISSPPTTPRNCPLSPPKTTQLPK